MPRLRVIYPDFWLDPEIGKLPPLAQLLYIATWNMADDQGVLINDSERLKAQVFPYRSLRLKAMQDLLDSLIQLNKLIPFSHNGTDYLYIKNFTKYQRIDHPSKTRLPSPPNNSLSPHRVLIESSPLEGGKGRGEEKGNKNKKENKNNQGSKKTPDFHNENRKKVFEELEKRRGYNSPVAGKEAKAITWMLKQGYTVEQIMGCHDKMGLDKFWQGKMLDMVNVQKQIGEYVKEEKDGVSGGAVSEAAGWEKLAGGPED